MSEFPTTRWTLVARAGDADPDLRRQALAELLRGYLPALHSHLVYRKRLPPDRADDLLQSFLADRVLSHALFTRAQQARGKFRNFVLTSLDRFAMNDARAARARKRSPDQAPTSLDAENAPQVGIETRPDAFDVDWARQIVAQAAARMRDECERAGRSDVWGVFEARVFAPTMTDVEPVGYGELVERYNLASPAQASNLLVTATRAFRRAIRDVIAEYEPDEASVDEEIRDLLRVLSPR